MWLNSLKIAIVEKDTEKLNKLLDNLPKLEKKEEIEEAIYLLKGANEMVSNLKDKTSASMKQMKKNMDFLNSTQSANTSRFDIKS
jgi:hypothetical protein